MIYPIIIEQLCKICHNRFTMSSANRKADKNFVKRFIEVCGTNCPKVISEKINISYQAAKNYLQGKRIPEPYILLVIADQTPYSLHWLLTGKGDKFVYDSLKDDLKEFINSLTEETSQADLLIKIGKFLKSYDFTKRHTPTDSPKTVTLSPDQTWEEKEEKEKISKSSSLNPS